MRAISHEDSHIEENELVRRLRAKDRIALEFLYDHYSAALFGVISRIVSKESVAEEVLQDIFLKVWNKIENYDPSKGRLFTWMLNIARNQAIDRMRSKEMSNEGKTNEIDILVNRDDLRSSEQNVEAIGVKDILDNLPEEQKFVVEWLYFKGYTQSELAEEFGIPLGTVKTRLRLALIKLRSIVKVN